MVNKLFDINAYEMAEGEWERKYENLLNDVDVEGEFPIFSR